MGNLGTWVGVILMKSNYIRHDNGLDGSQKIAV